MRSLVRINHALSVVCYTPVIPPTCRRRPTEGAEGCGSAVASKSSPTSVSMWSFAPRIPHWFPRGEPRAGASCTAELLGQEPGAFSEDGSAGRRVRVGVLPRLRNGRVVQRRFHLITLGGGEPCAHAVYVAGLLGQGTGSPRGSSVRSTSARRRRFSDRTTGSANGTFAAKLGGVET